MPFLDETGLESYDSKIKAVISATDNKATELANDCFQRRGGLSGADPTTSSVKVGTYTSQKTSTSTGYPSDMTVNHYCMITYVYVYGTSRTFLIYDTHNGKCWFCTNGTYYGPYALNADLTTLSNNAMQYRGSLAGADPTTSTITFGIYNSQKKSTSTGYPDGMQTNHYCYIYFFYDSTSVRSYLLLDSNDGSVWYYTTSQGYVPINTQTLSEIKWAGIGDSLTAPTTLRASQKYYDYISHKTGISFTNLGVSGTGYANDGNDAGTFRSRVSQIPADANVVTIFGSVNDMNALPIGTADDTTSSTVMGCVYLTIQEIFTQRPNVVLGIMAPTPTMDYVPYTSNNMVTFVTELEKLCKKYNVPFLDLFHKSNMRPWEASFRTAYYSKDDGNGTHPDENGYKRFTPMIEEFIHSLVSKFY